MNTFRHLPLESSIPAAMKFARKTAKVSRGFALVVTLSLMILLTVIALGLLGLSSVALRTASQSAAQQEARANARMALMLAIGEIQKNAGPDTRVTASADLVDPNNPPLTGVWLSWEGTNHELSGAFAGRPISPAYGDKAQTASAGGRFLSWLVSGTGSATTPADAKNLGSKTATAATVPLVSSNSLAASDTRQIHLPPVKIDNQGAMAWWVSGENQKARLPQPQQPASDTVAAWSAIANSHTVADPEPFQLESLLSNPAPAAKAITLETADLIQVGAKPSVFFHDLSTISTGLLTNTATGGWRKDLSLLTENWDSQPLSGLPLFRISPNTGNTSSAIRPNASNPTPGGVSGVMLYPWAEFPNTTSWPIARIGASSSWANLVDYALHYRRVSAGGQPSTALVSEHVFDETKVFQYLHQTRVLPVVARVQWVFSHGVSKQGANPPLFQPRLHLTPVVTMWNPYNVQITTPPKIPFRIPHTLPSALKYHIDGVANPLFNSLTTAVNNQPSLSATGTKIDFQLSINEAVTLLPGETRVFSPTNATPVQHSNAEISLTSGYRSGGGYFFRVRGPTGNSPLSLPGSTRIKAEVTFDTEDSYLGSTPAVGIYFDMYRDKGDGVSQPHLAYRMYFPRTTASAVYPPITDLNEVSLEECEISPRPFLSTIFGARTASNTHLAAKGFVQSNPLVNFTNLQNASSVLGASHPVNSPYDYSFVKHAGTGDDMLPNADPTNRGYIISGFTVANGLSRCVIAEMPLQALASLGELTHWDARFENPAPPYSLNIIGNSDASPLIPADAVYNSQDANDAKNRQYDASYCSNHLLFDDWFFSSIAPDSKLPGSKGRDQKDVYRDFVSGISPLVNRSYRPIADDRVTTPADGDALYTEHVSPTDAWQTIASRLEVEGMFNVNSTSVTAWRALLGHARDQRIPYNTASGGIALSEKSDYVLNRFSVAGDTKAGTAGTSGLFPEATEFSGYRTVDDPFLDALAEEVVKQIRLRGPFLSLSEFVNRQLNASNTDLALAGTIQAALNELSKSPGTDLYKNLKPLSTVSVADPPSAAGRDEEYQFREAAVGHSSYGLPGWTRQADVLRPLAPILSARDDTFTIRTYGDARDKAGKILAKVWCEATVRRTRDFVDPADPADSVDAPVSPANLAFGRKFTIISFRWLSPDEV